MSTTPSDPSVSIGQTIPGNQNQAIAQMLGGIAIGNQTVQSPRSLESARYCLPFDPTDFTGRKTEIEQIEADLSAGWVVAIAGMAGVGKSALAVRVAHRLKAQFPGGQIYLNLRGADTHPLSVESALESLLQALGVNSHRTRQAHRPLSIAPRRTAQSPVFHPRFARQRR